MPEGWRPAVEWSPPDNDVIDVWRLDLTVLEDDWDLLSPDESERASRILARYLGHPIPRPIPA